MRRDEYRKRFFVAVGAYQWFDRDLRLGNRFPVTGYAVRNGEFGTARSDLRGAFAMRLDGDEKEAFAGVFVSTNGPEHASNLLLPVPLLNDVLNCMARVDDIIAILPPCDGSDFVPSVTQTAAR